MFIRNARFYRPASPPNRVAAGDHHVSVDLDPETFLEWFTIIDVARLLLDLQNYSQWKNAYITLQYSAAVAEGLMQTHPIFLALGYTETVHAEVRVERDAWRKEPVVAKRLQLRLDAMGYTQDGLRASAFARASDTVVTIEHHSIMPAADEPFDKRTLSSQGVSCSRQSKKCSAQLRSAYRAGHRKVADQLA